MAPLLGKLRYLVIIAVVGIGVQAIATFGWAIAITVEFVDDLIRTEAWQQDDTVVELLQVLDLYLVGTVLLITAIGLYELFPSPGLFGGLARAHDRRRGRRTTPARSTVASRPTPRARRGRSRPGTQPSAADPAGTLAHSDRGDRQEQPPWPVPTAPAQSRAMEMGQLTLESISALVTVAFAAMLVVAMVDPVRVSLGAIGLALVAAVYQVLLMAIWMAKRREAPPSPK